MNRIPREMTTEVLRYVLHVNDDTEELALPLLETHPHLSERPPGRHASTLLVCKEWHTLGLPVLLETIWFNGQRDRLVKISDVDQKMELNQIRELGENDEQEDGSSLDEGMEIEAKQGSGGNDEQEADTDDGRGPANEADESTDAPLRLRVDKETKERLLSRLASDEERSDMLAELANLLRKRRTLGQTGVKRFIIRIANVRQAQSVRCILDCYKATIRELSWTFQRDDVNSAPLRLMWKEIEPSLLQLRPAAVWFFSRMPDRDVVDEGDVVRTWTATGLQYIAIKADQFDAGEDADDWIPQLSVPIVKLINVIGADTFVIRVIAENEMVRRIVVHTMPIKYQGLWAADEIERYFEDEEEEVRRKLIIVRPAVNEAEYEDADDVWIHD